MTWKAIAKINVGRFDVVLKKNLRSRIFDMYRPKKVSHSLDL